MNPANAKTPRELLDLREDNHSWGDYHIAVTDDAVCLSLQAEGNPPQESLTIPRKQWESIWHWYNKEQTP